MVKALKVSLLTAETPRAKPTTNIEAYTLYLQARAVALRASQADYETAIGLLRQSLNLDPKFAEAWAELANDIIDEYNWSKSRPAADARAEAYRAAAESIDIKPDLSDGHLAMAKLFHWIDWDWDAADAEFKKTLALDPNNGDALRLNSYLAQTLGQADRQLQLTQRAVAADPLNAWNYYALAGAQTQEGKLADAEASGRKAIELNPTGADMHSSLAQILIDRKEPAAALAEDALETDEMFRDSVRPYAFEALGRKSEADTEIAIFEKKYGAKAPGMIGQWYLCHNDFDHASVWFDRAYRQRDTSLLWNDECRRNLFSDHRYAPFLRKMQLLQ